MKKAILTLTALVLFCTTEAQFNKIEFSYWNAFDASYIETASEDVLIDLGDIWGDFNTQFFELKYRKTYLHFVGIELNVRGGLIQPNFMYLYNENSYLTIGGGMAGADLNVLFIPIQKKDLGLAVFAGFSYTYTNKTFTDYSVYTIPINSGTFGSYKASMFGPQAGLMANKSFLNGLISLDLNLYTNPLYENEVVLSGWSSDPTDDYAKGYRFGASFFADAHLLKFYAGLGYRYEKSYFKYSMNDKYDLDFHFSGVQLRAGIEL